ncbi:MAG: hypothetical protein ACRDTA_27640 [Pseudonocardiaceae bacterium]
MSDAVSFTELDGQHVELLPVRTVLSMFTADGGGVGGNGTDAVGTTEVNVLGIPVVPGNSNAVGGSGANADG